MCIGIQLRQRAADTAGDGFGIRSSGHDEILRRAVPAIAEVETSP
jgi:hypothetical protein